MVGSSRSLIYTCSSCLRAINCSENVCREISYKIVIICLKIEDWGVKMNCSVFIWLYQVVEWFVFFRISRFLQGDNSIWFCLLISSDPSYHASHLLVSINCNTERKKFNTKKLGNSICVRDCITSNAIVH